MKKTYIINVIHSVAVSNVYKYFWQLHQKMGVLITVPLE